MSKISERTQIINKAINTKWFFLTKRPDIPPLPIWYKMKLSSLSKEHKKIYNTNIPWVFFYYDNNMEVYLHGKEYRLIIQKATEIFYSKQKFDKHLIKLKQSCYDVKEIAKIFYNPNWKNFDNKQLFNSYISIIEKYILSFIYGFVTWCTLVLQHDAKLIINNHRKSLDKINISPEQALGILIVPNDLTLYQKKNKILNKLSKKYKAVLNGYKSKNFLVNNYPKLYTEIEDFINKYCWVDFNYNGPALDYRTLIKELLQLQDKNQSNLPIKKDIYKVCKFNKEEKHVFYVFEMLSYTKDLRNLTDDYVHYCLNNFYKEVSKRTGMKKKDIQFLWDNELKKLIIEKDKFTLKYIKNKQKFCGAITLAKSLGFKQYYIGQEARNCRKNILRNSDRLSKNLSQNNIKGTIASTGLAIGKVKVIHSLDEIGKIKKGDILVTGMTSPKYVSAIHNSGAIITDDGGLTCHAAIIARELKIPCIIGTKIATQVFKDGDLVEVDANKGIVKKIS